MTYLLDLALFSAILFIKFRIWISEMRFNKFLLSLINSMYVDVPLIDNAICNRSVLILNEMTYVSLNKHSVLRGIVLV